MLIDLPPGQALAFRWGVTASSFVFSIISFCSLMAGLWSLVKHNDDLCGNRQEKDLQCTLDCLWVCETALGRLKQRFFFFSFLIMSANPVKEVAEFECYLLASLYCMEHSLGGINLYLELLCVP